MSDQPEDPQNSASEDGQDPATQELAAAAEQVEFVVLPVACIEEGKGAPLSMGMQRFWAQELAEVGTRAAAPVFTAMAEQEGKKVPALMIFKEAWTPERVAEGMQRFPNAKVAMTTNMRVIDDNNITFATHLLKVDGENVETIQAWEYAGKAEDLPAQLVEQLGHLCKHFGNEPRATEWPKAFGTENVQATVSFLLGLGNLSALQGRCVPAQSDQLLTPFMDAINRDAEMDLAMQALHSMVEILSHNPPDQAAVPLSVQALSVAVQRRPKDQGAVHHLAVLLARLGDVRSAVNAYNQAFNLDPKHAAVAVGFIELLRRAGDNENAMKVAQFAAENGNEAPELFAHLGGLMIEGDQHDAAEPFLRRALDEGKIPSAYGDLANVLWDRADPGVEEGKEDRDEALALLSAAVDQPQIAKTTLDLLLDLHEEDALEDARVLLLKAVEKHPEDATVLRYVATMYLDGDDPSKARDYLDHILNLDRRTLDDDAFARRGLLTLDIDEFEDLYDAAIDQVRGDDPAQKVEAAKFLRTIIAKDAQFWQPHLMLALAVREGEGDAAALGHLTNAARLRPNDLEIRTLLSAILRRLGRPAEAVEHLRAAVSINPQDASLVVNLATCLRDANQFDEARQVCEASLQMVPDHPEFKKILEGLPAPKTQS